MGQVQLNRLSTRAGYLIFRACFEFLRNAYRKILRAFQAAATPLLESFPPHHALQDQYLAENLSFAVSQLCRALKFDLRAGWSFLIDMFGSPKRTNLIWSPFLAKTALFFDLPGVRLGLLKPAKVSPLYLIFPEGVLVTFFTVAIVPHLKKNVMLVTLVNVA